MKTFACPSCSTIVFFENTSCLDCGAELSYDPRKNEMVHREPGGGENADCGNRGLGVCNWNVAGSPNAALCTACNLNRTIPNLNDVFAFERWMELEIAKHRMIYSLVRFHLPIVSKFSEAVEGLVFDFLSAETNGGVPVMTGHLDGVITIDIAEADPVSREARRVRLREPYRTLVGHFRHEIGHYYWDRLVAPSSENLSSFRELFGDERNDYNLALQAYHQSGAPLGWEMNHVTAYSTAHPWEDWAETWAHYFHLVDLLETAHEFKVAVNPTGEAMPPITSVIDFDPYQHVDFDDILEASLGLTLTLNSLNRSVGQPDIYPFAIPEAAKAKLAFVHQIVQTSAA